MALARLDRYGPLNSHDVIKALALLIMTIDHIGAYVLVDELWWRAVGRVTFPVWFFLIGYARSARIDTALWVYALVLIVVNVLMGHPLLPMNALVSIICCRVVLNLCERKQLITRYPAETIVACLFAYLITIPLFEYGTLAVAFAVFGRMVRREMHGPLLARIAAGLALFFIISQCMSFNFTVAQCAFVTIGTAWCCYALYRFTVVPVPMPLMVQAPLMIASRYSLEYYVLHRTVLQAIGLALGIFGGHFVWIKL